MWVVTRSSTWNFWARSSLLRRHFQVKSVPVSRIFFFRLATTAGEFHREMTSDKSVERVQKYFPDTNEQLRSSLGGMVFVLARKLSCTEWAPFHLSFRESCLFHILAPMPSLYAGETGRNLRSRFSEHLRRIRNNTPGFPVAQHFNSTGHSISDVQVRGMVWHYAVVLTFNESNVRCGWLFH